jgi:hypothetical protein
MTQVRDAVKLAMTRRRNHGSSHKFILPSKLILDVVDARCDCGKLLLAQKDVFTPLHGFLSGTWRTTIKPVDVTIVSEQPKVDEDHNDYGGDIALVVREGIKAWAALATPQFTYW